VTLYVNCGGNLELRQTIRHYYALNFELFEKYERYTEMRYSLAMAYLKNNNAFFDIFLGFLLLYWPGFAKAT
jgi:hypothetical protein